MKLTPETKQDTRGGVPEAWTASWHPVPTHNAIEPHTTPPNYTKCVCNIRCYNLRPHVTFLSPIVWRNLEAHRVSAEVSHGEASSCVDGTKQVCLTSMELSMALPHGGAHALLIHYHH